MQVSRGEHAAQTQVLQVEAAEGRLRGYRHAGVWLTVNTPKDLRRATDFIEDHPDWRPVRELA